MYPKGATNYTDKELVELLNQSYKPAFDCIYERYWETLFLHIVKVIRDEDAAQDIVQEVFVDLWTKRAVLVIHTSLRSYLFTAVRYRSFTWLAQNMPKESYTEDYANDPAFSDDSLLNKLYADELQTLIDKQLSLLPPKMKQIFLLSRDEQLSHKEIAEKLQISDQTVKKQISRALKHFRLRIGTLLSFFLF